MWILGLNVYPRREETAGAFARDAGRPDPADIDLWRAARAGHRAIEPTSDDELLVEHGALYPALQRLEERGWISAKWGISSKNRKARFYSLTAAGRKQLVKETTKWKRLTAAVGRILASEAKRS